MAARLELADRWLDGHGRWQPLSELDAGRLWGLLVYLRSHAPVLMAQDRGRTTGDPGAWLASRPLVIGLDAELATRGDCDRGQALDTLRVLGLAPWERRTS
jgi:hypothetical protein